MNKHLIKLLTLSFIFCQFSKPAHAQEIVAFPGAEGFGRFATGGRGGDVYHVTNLSDFGPGSLRFGIQSAQGPRTIVFDLSGNIMLNSSLDIDKSNITIAGQTAPGDGITLGGNDLKVKADHIIVRYIRARLGDQSGGDDDAIHISSGSNIIFDHVSTSWSVDETFSFQSSEIDSVTVQWCMITESLRYSHHEKGAHGYGGIIGGLRQSVHHNLYAHHSSRSPKVSGRRHCEVDFRNNVIYNWGFNNCYDGTASYLNWANNYYKAGPGTNSDVRKRIFNLSDEDIAAGGSNSPEDSQNYETSLYAEGNYVDGYPAVTADNWNGGIDFSDGATEEKNRALSAFDFPAITEQTPVEVYPLVLEKAGASLARDSIDVRIVEEVKNGTVTYGNKGIIDSQEDVGGWPGLKSATAALDTDQDGMPDYFETVAGLNPGDPSDRNGDRNGDGYTNLEEYLNGLLHEYPVSVSDLNETGTSLRCFPNPASGKFSVDLEGFGCSNICIYNLYGRVVYHTYADDGILTIADHKLKAGVYILSIAGAHKEKYTQKLIIEPR